MEVQGRIIMVSPEVGGTSKAGNEWRKQEYILETQGQYPKKICFSLWGDRIDTFAIEEGEDVTVSIDIESREYNGRWYTEVRAYKVQRGFIQDPSMPEVNPVNSNFTQGAPSFNQAEKAESDPFENSNSGGDELPF